MSKNKNNIVRMQPQVENNNPPEEETKDEEVPVNETPEAPVGEKKPDWADKLYARHVEKRAEREAKAAERDAKRAEKEAKPKKKIGKGVLIGGTIAAVVVGKAILRTVLDAANSASQSVPQLEAGEPELVTLPEDTGETVNETAQET